MTQKIATGHTKCPSCGKLMGPAFCEHCGEKRLDANSRSLRHILSDYIENMTSFDNKIWRTLKLLLFKPGRYDLNYHQGRRIQYLKPISLFLIINFLFVLFSPISDFNVVLYDQLHLQPYSEWILEHHQNKLLPDSGLSPETYESNYNQSVKILSRSTIIIQALLFFLAVMVINHRRGYYPGDHLIYALNLHSWYMAWIVILMVILKSLALLFHSLGAEFSAVYWYFKLLPVGMGVYLLLSIHTLYHRIWWQTLVLAGLLFLAMRVCHTVYRFIQYFLVTSLI